MHYIQVQHEQYLKRLEIQIDPYTQQSLNLH